MVVPEHAGAVSILTTPQLERDLTEIDQLIAALRRACNVDLEDLDDLSWLQGRRRYVLALLGARRAQKGKRIVSLDLWRNGGLRANDIAPRAA